MRVLAAWIAILSIIGIAALVSQLWDERERRKERDALRARAKEQITRGFDGFPKLKSRALEAANRSTKPK